MEQQRQRRRRDADGEGGGKGRKCINALATTARSSTETGGRADLYTPEGCTQLSISQKKSGTIPNAARRHHIFDDPSAPLGWG